MDPTLFPLRPLPTSLTIPIEEASSDIDDLEKILGGRQWNAISDGELRKLAYTFSLLTGEAMRYYLPSLLGCRVPEIAESAILITCPTMSNSDQIDLEGLRRTFGPYSAQQRAAVAQFLLPHRLEYTEIDQAIREFWGNPP